MIVTTTMVKIMMNMLIEVFLNWQNSINIKCLTFINIHPALYFAVKLVRRMMLLAIRDKMIQIYWATFNQIPVSVDSRPTFFLFCFTQTKAQTTEVPSKLYYITWSWKYDLFLAAYIYPGMKIEHKLVLCIYFVNSHHSWSNNNTSTECRRWAG